GHRLVASWCARVVGSAAQHIYIYGLDRRISIGMLPLRPANAWSRASSFLVGRHIRPGLDVCDARAHCKHSHVVVICRLAHALTVVFWPRVSFRSITGS